MFLQGHLIFEWKNVCAWAGVYLGIVSVYLCLLPPPFCPQVKVWKLFCKVFFCPFHINLGVISPLLSLNFNTYCVAVVYMYITQLNHEFLEGRCCVLFPPKSLVPRLEHKRCLLNVNGLVGQWVSELIEDQLEKVDPLLMTVIHEYLLKVFCELELNYFMDCEWVMEKKKLSSSSQDSLVDSCSLGLFVSLKVSVIPCWSAGCTKKCYGICLEYP